MSAPISRNGCAGSVSTWEGQVLAAEAVHTKGRQVPALSYSRQLRCRSAAGLAVGVLRRGKLVVGQHVGGRDTHAQGKSGNGGENELLHDTLHVSPAVRRLCCC